MFSVSLKAARDLQYEEIEEPKLAPGCVLVAVYASGICGSDMHRYIGEEPVTKPNIVCGHEFGGRIYAVAEDVQDLKVGQNVAVNPACSCGKCRYCQAGLEYLCDDAVWSPAMTERVCVQAKTCVPMPDSFDMLYSPLVEPAATAIHASNGIFDSKVVVIGMGTVGLFAMQLLHRQNNQVVLADVSEYALDQARKLGGQNLVNLRNADCKKQILACFGGDNPDWVLDGVGITQTVDFSTALVKKRGHVRIIGASRIFIEFNCRTALLKEIFLESIYIYTENDYRKAAQMFIQNDIEYAGVVSKVFSLQEAKEAFEYKRTQPSTKVLLKHETLNDRKDVKQ